MEVAASLDGGAAAVAAMVAADDDAVVKQESPPAMQQQVLLKSSSNAPNGNGGGGGGCRLPRWSRHETLVLVEAKKAEEARLKSRHANGAEPGGSSTKAAGGESKWYSIAAFCKRRGADRQAKHCRKRWSNLFGDYKRIKEWQMLNGSDSFWVMRNDLRKEKKLPGAFDREVFDALEDFMNRKPSMAAGSVLDGPRIAPDEGLFSDIEHPVDPMLNVPITENSVSVQDSAGDKPQTNTRRKRKRTTHSEAEDQNDQFLNVLECNCKALAAHIDAQNLNSELDRAQKKELADNLLSVLGKLTEALAKIAEKL